MKQLSLLDKFKILFDNIIEHPLFIVILLVPAIIFLLQKKHGKKAFVLVYLLVIIFVLYIGGEVIFELFDNLMDGLFMTLYFPNFITLFVVVVLCSIIALFSFFSKKMFKINKIINITGFAFIQMLFVLILTLVRSKNINIYADNALYSNNDVLTLMQLLIGTFALQVIAILIINAINKVTDILDRRSSLAEDISKQITDLEKTKNKNNLGLIKNIQIDNSKVGYINVADKKKTSKPKLKPFKFDVDKLESITLNVPEEDHSQEFEKMFVSTPVMVENPSEHVKVLPTTDNKIEEVSVANKPAFKDKMSGMFKSKPNKKKRNVLLPKEKSKPVITSSSDIKPNLMKPMEDMVDVSFHNTVDKVNEAKDTIMSGGHINKFINEVKPELKETSKPDLLKPEPQAAFNPDLMQPKVVAEKPVINPQAEPVDLVDNLNIVDIQSTLDTVVKYKLMRGVNLKAVPEDSDVAVDNLQIPNFDDMLKALRKYKLYKKV